MVQCECAASYYCSSKTGVMRWNVPRKALRTRKCGTVLSRVPSSAGKFQCMCGPTLRCWALLIVRAAYIIALARLPHACFLFALSQDVAKHDGHLRPDKYQYQYFGVVTISQQHVAVCSSQSVSNFDGHAPMHACCVVASRCASRMDASLCCFSPVSNTIVLSHTPWIIILHTCPDFLPGDRHFFSCPVDLTSRRAN